MDEGAVRRLLDEVRAGTLSADDAVEELRRLPFADLGFARVDHHRALRQGRAETVYGPGKTPEQCAAIVAELLRSGDSPIVLTRATAAQIETVTARNPAATVPATTVVWHPAAPRPGRVVLATAGTSDLPVAEECAATLWAHGVDPIRLTDVGVAGVHRLLASADALLDADAVVVVAGM